MNKELYRCNGNPFDDFSSLAGCLEGSDDEKTDSETVNDKRQFARK